MFKAPFHPLLRATAKIQGSSPIVGFISLVLFGAMVTPGMARPRIGLATYTCRELTFEQMVDFAVEHGIREVEVYTAHLDPEALDSVNTEKKAYLEKKGVRAYAGYYALDADMARNRRAFELARLFDMDFIVVEPKDLALWDDIEKLVKEFDIRVAIHNHGPGTVYADPATVRKIMAERDTRIGVCLDVGWAAAAGHDVAQVFLDYGDRVWDVHFKDKTESRLVDGRPCAEDRPIGQGRANLKGLAERMKQTGWSGVLALESDSEEVAKAPAEFVENGRKFSASISSVTGSGRGR
jgi:sugar phosphate isomerase/epimerase